MKQRSQKETHMSTVTDFKQGCQDHLMGKRQSFPQIMCGQVVNYMQKNVVVPLPHTIYKN